MFGGAIKTNCRVWKRASKLAKRERKKNRKSLQKETSSRRQTTKFFFCSFFSFHFALFFFCVFYPRTKTKLQFFSVLHMCDCSFRSFVLYHQPRTATNERFKNILCQKVGILSSF